MVLRKLLPALAAVVLVGCSAGAPKTPSSAPNPTDGPVQSSAAVSPGPAAPGMDAGQRSVLLDRIGADGGVDRELALTAFSWTFGPIDGVDVETRPAGDPGIEPSLAIRWFMRYRDTLPADVVAAAEAAYSPAGESGTVTPDDIVAADPQGLDLVQVIEQGVVLHRFAAGRLEPSVEQLRTMVTVAAKELSTATGATLHLAMLVVKNTTEKLIDGEPAYGWSERRSADSPDCLIGFNPSLFAKTAADVAAVLLHEVWHCFQWDYSYQGTLTRPGWITEGQAEFVSGAVLRSVAPILAEKYDEWLATPGTPLFARTYDAVGFYATLVEAGLSPLATLLAMYDNPGNEAAYTLITGGESQLVLDEWASSYADDPDYGEHWWLDQHQMSPHEGNAASEVLSLGMQSVTLTTNAFTVTLSTLEPHADVMHFAINGSARISDLSFGGSVDVVGVSDESFCSMDAMNRTGCRCPTDTADDAALQVLRVGLLARTGASSGVQGSYEGMTFEDYCSRRAPATAPDGCDPDAWLRPGDVEPLAVNWNYQSTPCSLRFEYVPESGDPLAPPAPPSTSRTVFADLQVFDELGDLADPNPTDPIPELGPYAHIPEGMEYAVDGGGISSAGTMIVFGCGRKYCVLSLSEASVPAEPVSVVHDHAVALALLVQQRAAG